ncbi:MAG: hypothetical protein KF914_00225 [Rhizobiaceae bacterium]|nr:hypothetical protein [Rhizobiaceae bacterium]
MGDQDSDGRKRQPDRRAERLAAELRANLMRRKAQARSRRDEAQHSGDEPRAGDDLDSDT